MLNPSTLHLNPNLLPINPIIIPPLAITITITIVYSPPFQHLDMLPQHKRTTPRLSLSRENSMQAPMHEHGDAEAVEITDLVQMIPAVGGDINSFDRSHETG